jgi:hypothetical protein
MPQSSFKRLHSRTAGIERNSDKCHCWLTCFRLVCDDIPDMKASLDSYIFKDFDIYRLVLDLLLSWSFLDDFLLIINIDMRLLWLSLLAKRTVASEIEIKTSNFCVWSFTSQLDSLLQYSQAVLLYSVMSSFVLSCCGSFVAEKYVCTQLSISVSRMTVCVRCVIDTTKHLTTIYKRLAIN